MTVDEMMIRMGFAPTDCGPYVTQLRASVAQQIADGLQNRSAGSWAPGEHTAEERAKAFLAWDFEIARGHCCTVKVIDPIIQLTWNWKTGLRGIRFAWRRLPAWLGDRGCECAMKFRIWRDRKIANPYLN